MLHRLDVTVSQEHAKTFTNVILLAAIYNNYDAAQIDFNVFKDLLKDIEIENYYLLYFNYFDNKITVDEGSENVFSITIVELQNIDENE